MSGGWHALLLVATGAAAGAALVNLLYLLHMLLDAIAAGEVEQRHLWPDPRGLTVWTGEDWFTVTVVPVAFGRWGITVCRDSVPRRAQPLDFIERARTQRDPRGRAVELAGQALSDGQGEVVVLLAR